MKERFKSLGLLVPNDLPSGLLVGGVTSQAVAQMSQMTVMPGMPFIANSAINAPMLGEILTGQIPATIPQYLTMPDPTGQISTYQPFGPTITAGHGFFTSTGITNNGRTCFTCHQPQNDWEISPPQILTELITTWGKSALFQPIDTANRPNAPGVTAPFPDPRFFLTRSLFFKLGTFRIGINAPNPLGPQSPDASYTTFDGNTTPEWVLTVEYDPYGSEMDKKFGLPNNLLSVYRRPLNACNLAFLNRDETLTGPVPAPANEDKLDIMWDAREPSLQSQFTDATEFHGQINVAPPLAAIKQGVVFQSGMFAAQSYDNIAGDLTGASGDGALGGPMNLYNFQKSSLLGVGNIWRADLWTGLHTCWPPYHQPLQCIRNVQEPDDERHARVNRARRGPVQHEDVRYIRCARPERPRHPGLSHECSLLQVLPQQWQRGQ